MNNELLDSDMLEGKDGKSLSSLLANGYETHSTEYIKKGFELFKQDIGSFIGFLFIVAILEGLISVIPFIKGFAGPILAPVFAGSFIVAKMIDKGEPHMFSNFFDGTKKYKELFLVTLLPTLLMALIFLVVGGWTYFKISFLGLKPDFTGMGMNSLSSYAGFAGRGMLAVLIVVVISILFMLSNFLVLFENFQPVRALDISTKLVSKKFFNWLGFILLLILFNLAGLICLVVGLFVTIPSSVCALYVAYEDVVGLNLRD